MSSPSFKSKLYKLFMQSLYLVSSPMSQQSKSLNTLLPYIKHSVTKRGLQSNFLLTGVYMYVPNLLNKSSTGAVTCQTPFIVSYSGSSYGTMSSALLQPDFLKKLSMTDGSTFLHTYVTYIIPKLYDTCSHFLYYLNGSFFT